jgi:hypothetical protein
MSLYDIAHVLESADRAGERVLHVLELLRGVVPYEQCALLEARLGHEPRVVIVPPIPPDERAQLTGTLVHLFGELIGSNAGAGGAAAPTDGRHLAVPLVGLDNVIGLLFVRRSVGEYAADDVRALSVIAAQLAAYFTMLSAGPMRSSEQPIRLADATLGEHRHLCAFFNGSEEAYQVLLPFIKGGFERGERAFHVVNPGRREEHLRRLESLGIAAPPAAHGGSFDLRGWDEAYLRDGHFDQDMALALLRDAIDGGQPGLPPNRVVCDMGWALEDRPGTSDLVKYETRLNQVLPAGGRYAVICCYEPTNFSAGVILDILRTHPAVILGGVPRVNPFFVPPDQFLDELGRREGGAAGL